MRIHWTLTVPQTIGSHSTYSTKWSLVQTFSHEITARKYQCKEHVVKTSTSLRAALVDCRVQSFTVCINPCTSCCIWWSKLTNALAIARRCAWGPIFKAPLFSVDPFPILRACLAGTASIANELSANPKRAKGENTKSLGRELFFFRENGRKVAVHPKCDGRILVLLES
jgi:hypothetical protein